MERRARIELATRTWKDRVIPFYERRVLLIIQQTSRFVYLFGRGDEIRTHDTDFKDQCLRPLGDTPTCFMVQPTGIEPVSMALQTTAMTTSAKVAIIWYPGRESNSQNSSF